ncbi:glycoside hydrolase family 2, sugar binding protein [Pedobacter sp. BAL39]|uniref:glycosyl hydrolase n=1 Tax=Pedobacter sp. BAL39 TaxID=391596 RepID=UPI00015596D6|nr:glycosyl hydrolase [Pedobacter sp. BAL39]EDM37703.1 glycoside hydrolase family 2, sugar binding protein [Pedobacter sp. BAL39]
MKIQFYLLMISACFAGFSGKGQTVNTGQLNALEHNFTDIPDTVQTSVYWYWISGNISKEGVVKDLESMKKVGINRAFIGNIGLDDVAYGPVKLFSDAWWDILHTALKAATRLNIEIGIFNGPGWSQSGGPWVKPQQSMRYLSSVERMVKGPSLFKGRLDQPHPDFQDVKVLAYPVAADFNQDIAALKPKLNARPAVAGLELLMDGNIETVVRLPRSNNLSIEVNAPSAYTVRSLTLMPVRQTVHLEGEVQAILNGSYQTIKRFSIDRSNRELNVGFSPFSPAVVALPATTAKDFRIVFSNVSADCELAELSLSATPKVEAFAEKTLAKMWPTPHPFWQAYQWQTQPDDARGQVIDPSKVIDISKYLSPDGILNWEVPAGNWIIERTGMAPTQVKNAPAEPIGTGLEVDKMSSKHVEAHFEAFLGEILKRIPPEDRKTWKVNVQDSYETGGQNWTDEMERDFLQAYHYDPMPYMPVLQGKVVGSREMSDRFLWDLRRLIADNVSYKYVGAFRDISHKNGLTTWLENYGHWGFPGEFLQYGGQSDEVGGEFWSEGDLGDIENKAASSAAHIYGKNKVSAESFTAAGNPFYRYPALFKKRGDRFFTEGINNTLMHVYISQPADQVPGLDAWFGVEFNRHNTWFYDMDVFLKYIKRCNMMLQQGRYEADVAYFIGEDAPKMTGVTDPALPQGYSYDYINAEVLKNRIKVENGKLTLPNGLNYSILVLPKIETMRPELLRKIKDFVAQGAVVLGPAPKRSPSLEGFPSADQEVAKLANELWGNIDGKNIKVNRFGKGLVMDGMGMQEALDLIKVAPDLKITQSDSVLFIHRKLPEASVYFISNQKAQEVSISATFRIRGKQPELWDPATGSTRELPAFSQTDSSTSVPLRLAPLESCFIVFRKDAEVGTVRQTAARRPELVNYLEPLQKLTIGQPWSVVFDSKMGGPAAPVIFDQLTDWSAHADERIRYYSGTAVYHNVIELKKLKKGQAVFLDLGMARAIAKVTVNGIELGGLWTAPYKVDISKAVKKGKNKIEIKVVNTWVNRLIGESRLPAAERKISAAHANYNPQSRLSSSGLLGPVYVEVY